MQLLPRHLWTSPFSKIPPLVPDGVAANLDRRRYSRFPAVEDRARLSWGDGPKSCERAALLVDISRGGARLISKEFIPDATTLKISLDGGDGPQGDVLGRIVRIGQCAGVGHLIHVEFFQPCPEPLFERAIGGAGKIEPAPMV